jgi:hypothetical protein
MNEGWRAKRPDLNELDVPVSWAISRELQTAYFPLKACSQDRTDLDDVFLNSVWDQPETVTSNCCRRNLLVDVLRATPKRM